MKELLVLVLVLGLTSMLAGCAEVSQGRYSGSDTGWKNSSDNQSRSSSGGHSH